MELKIKNSLKNKLVSNLSDVGLKTDFILDLREYSKKYNGYYEPKKKKIVLYTLEEDFSLISYDLLFSVMVHEAVHHYQYQHQFNFIRYEGIMHDYTFKQLYENFLELAISKGIIQEKYVV